MLGESLSEARFDELARRAGSQRRWLRLAPADVGTSYNRTGFLVEHDLAEHPLFSHDALRLLCRRLPPTALKIRSGVVPVDTHFDSSIGVHRGSATLDDAIDRLEETRSYLAIYNPELDAAYRPTIEGLVGELGRALRARERAFNWYSTYVFISAHDAVTPYHMDREMNFLLQVRGRKTVELWDPRDDEVMRPAQRDHLFSHAVDARPPYHDGLPAKARRFELRPGLGVHHPFIAPHVVTTGPNLSISLAITFRTPLSDLWSDAHRCNEHLRRFGLGHVPVGRFHALDAFKAGAFRTMRGARDLLRSSAPVGDGGGASGSRI